MVKRGIPAAPICSASFVVAARGFARSLGVPELPIVEVDNAVGHNSSDELRAVAKGVADGLHEILNKYRSGKVADRGGGNEASSDIMDIEAGADLSARVSELFLQENWTDGLPVLAPTEERVDGMLSAVSNSPDELIGVLLPRGGHATVKKVAVCAVMAGCQPKQFPIVLAAVRAIASPDFGLHTLQATAHPHSPFMLVNGPAAVKAGMSNGHDCTPKGWQANISICRAVRLVTINMAGIKNVIASHTQGYVGRFVDCIRENEEENPWSSFHTELGYSKDASVITVFPAEAPHLVDDRGSTTPQSLLTTFARVVATAGNRSTFGSAEHIFLFAPSHAEYLGSHGFSKEDIRDFLYHVARIPFDEFPKDNVDSLSPWHKKMFSNVSGRITVPFVRDKSDIRVIVHGGRGPHSMYVPGSLASRSVTIPIV